MPKKNDSIVEDEDLKDEDVDVESEESEDEIDESEEQDDEVNEDEETEETDDSDESEDDESEEEEDESDDKKVKFEKKYSQFKGDTLKEYTKNLEDGYKNSSAEAVRLSKLTSDQQVQIDKMTKVFADNPELAEKLKDAPAPQTDPALLHARDSLAKQMQKEYREFVDEYPEVETDEALAKELLEELGTLGETYRAKGKVLSMSRGLRMAWVSLGKDLNDDNEKVAMKAKETAAQGKSSSATRKKPKAKVEFSDTQIQVGLDIGLGNTREEVIKKLRKHATNN